MANTDTKRSVTIEVGKGKAYFDVQLLSLQFYSLMDSLLMAGAGSGDIGRIKDALVWNGIPTVDPSHPKKARKPISVEHPEWYGGKRKEFRLLSQDAPLNHASAPKVEQDGEFMAYLGDRIAVEVARANPGLSAKYENLLGMLERLAGLKEDAEDEEVADGEVGEDEFNPAFEADAVAEEEDEEVTGSTESEEAAAVAAGNPTE